jgi:hypothetical protein
MVLQCICCCVALNGRKRLGNPYFSGVHAGRILCLMMVMYFPSFLFVSAANYHETSMAYEDSSLLTLLSPTFVQPCSWLHVSDCAEPHNFAIPSASVTRIQCQVLI